jgi:hypothetical protein
MASVNICYLLEHKEAELLKQLEQSIVQEIIVKAFENYRSDINFNNKHLIDLLCRLRDCKSVFELLRQEN